MTIDHSLNIAQTTTLNMTPQLRQAIKMLQLSHEELDAFVHEQIESNPLLSLNSPNSPYEHYPKEKSGHRVSKGSIHDNNGIDSLQNHAQSITLHEHLAQQVQQNLPNPVERSIAAYLAYYITPAGYFEESPEVIAQQLSVPIQHIEKGIDALQQCDPCGIAARNLKECLMLQLKEKGIFDTDFQSLLNSLDLLAQGALKQIAKKHHIPFEVLSAKVKVLQTLNPKPGLQFESALTQTMIPEVIVTLDPITGEWTVEINPETTPHVFMDKAYYQKISSQRMNRDEKSYVSEKFTHANWLLKSLEQRTSTLLSVSEEIVKHQANFFKWGIQYLKPLTLKTIAERTNLHESTISRVTTNKYITTPRGVFELKYFFNSSLEGQEGQLIASESVRHHMFALIQSENPLKPLSDAQLCKKLEKCQVHIARRTVSKYRELMKIPPAFARKRSLSLKSALKKTS